MATIVKRCTTRARRVSSRTNASACAFPIWIFSFRVHYQGGTLQVSMNYFFFLLEVHWHSAGIAILISQCSCRVWAPEFVEMGALKRRSATFRSPVSVWFKKSPLSRKHVYSLPIHWCQLYAITVRRVHKGMHKSGVKKSGSSRNGHTLLQAA